MKKIVAFSLLLAGSHYASASEVHAESDAKAGEGFGGLSGMMVGAAAGGPVGALAGAMAGMFTGENVQDVTGISATDNKDVLASKLSEKKALDERFANLERGSRNALN
ncbi:hypothetical protein [Azomonas macrocytogenes]|uniref:Glycine zipper domain-containing protein n=1 Tax=Azomonas macrocytogenes TaxID=69962 RepID=A0A839TAL6_AZOMA|nr:hypothetical protein [Azomonas macrocytogenes]MBB3104663.1 hypothetical protein [Azomonas macrocytogenes]